jgi:IS5 family transposase
VSQTADGTEKDNVEEDGDDDEEALEADTTMNSTATMTHAERQEAFKAKSKQKGGRGGPKTRPATKSAAAVTAPRASGSAPPAASAPATNKGGKTKTKVKVEGKKAAYLAEKKRRAEAKARGE